MQTFVSVAGAFSHMKLNSSLNQQSKREKWKAKDKRPKRDSTREREKKMTHAKNKRRIKEETGMI